MKLHQLLALLVMLTLATGSSTSVAQSSDKDQNTKAGNDHVFDVAGGKYQFTAPGAWKKVKPKFAFFQAEFKIPKVAGDEQDGRITFSQVGGTIDQNLERWVGQFELSDSDQDAIKKSTRVIEGTKVQIIHITGTFLESAGGPMGPKTERENYVLMGAALETDDGGNVYIKAYGPRKTMESNHDSLKSLLDNMKVADG